MMKKRRVLSHLSFQDGNGNPMEANEPYSLQEAIAESSRCLSCYEAPCTEACPVGIDVPTFIGRIKTRDFKGAVDIIRENNIFAGTCGSICPVEEKCEGSCVMKRMTSPIAIGKLQRFAAESMVTRTKENKLKITRRQKIAVIGAGPAGLTIAAELLRLGYSVELFEKKSEVGGLLTHGIPAYRLPENIASSDIAFVEGLRPKIHIKRTIQNVKSLLEKFDAVFVGIGTCKCAPLSVPGSSLSGVFSGIDVLERLAKGKPFSLKRKRVAVIGGGDVAVDAARSAKRLGAESVYLVYRRSINELPASRRQILAAKEEGIETILLSSPTRILGHKAKAIGCEFAKVRLGKPDATGRRRPILLKGSEFRLDVDMIITAIGQIVDEEFLMANPDIKVSGNLIAVDTQTGMTAIPGVFAGGDVTNGGATVVQAVADGKRAARGIDEYLKKKRSN